MNPRVSRSSALASKATGFPIAKIAAKLAVGYTLDEIPQRHHAQDARGVRADDRLRGRQDAALRVREVPRRRPRARHADEVGRRGRWRSGARSRRRCTRRCARSRLGRCRRCWRTYSGRGLPRAAAAMPGADRLRRCCWSALAARARSSRRRSHALTAIDPLVPARARGEIVDRRARLQARRSRRQARAPREPSGRASPTRDRHARGATATTCARAQSARACPSTRVDTCAAEFEASRRTSTRPTRTTARGGADDRRKVIILGGGPEPHRAGHRVRLLLRPRRVRAARARARDRSWSTATRRRSRPTTTRPTGCTSSRSRSRTCSTIVDDEKPEGVIVQFGGQTPLKLAVRAASTAGVPLLGTSADAIDRRRGSRALRRRCSSSSGSPQPRERDRVGVGGGRAAGRSGIGYPVLRAAELRARRPGDGDRRTTRRSSSDYVRQRRRGDRARAATILIDQFLEDAIEVDVDAICDGEDVVIGGVMEHIEEAGVHSGDSAMRAAAALARPTRCSRDPRERHARSRSSSASSA